MQEFDFPSAIKELAEATEPCPGRSLLEIQHFLPCGICDGTGRTWPFASLRLDCDCHCHSDNVLRGFAKNPGTHFGNPCRACGGRGWIPEPDVEKVCWRIMKRLVAHNYFWERLEEDWAMGREGTLEEALIRAALAWMKEQHEAPLA